MKIRVLGCHGSEVLGTKLCGFLINDSFALDAGSITSTLTLTEQKEIRYVMVTHSHLDHVKDIAFLADNLQDKKAEPINIVSSENVVQIIKKHLLNGKIWPDFTKLPSPSSPVLKYLPLPINRPTEVGGLNLRLIKTFHTVPAVAYEIEKDDKTVIFSGDCGPDDEIWNAANLSKNLKALFISVSFPNNMEEIANVSRHLTPRLLKTELAKLKVTVPIYAYHLKTQFEEEIKSELASLLPQVKILEEGQVITF